MTMTPYSLQIERFKELKNREGGRENTKKEREKREKG